MEAIKFDKDKHYSMVVEWWNGHKWPVMPIEYLPVNGVVVDGLAAGFLYKTDSKIAWMEFIVNNPKAEKEERREALNLVIDGLIKQAKDENFGIIFTSVKHPALIKRLQEKEFMNSDNEMLNMVRRV